MEDVILLIHTIRYFGKENSNKNYILGVFRNDKDANEWLKDNFDLEFYKEFAYMPYKDKTILDSTVCKYSVESQVPDYNMLSDLTGTIENNVFKDLLEQQAKKGKK